MMHDDMMVGAFSHSTAVGKLRQELPDVPVDARINLPRYTLDEAETVFHYYLRYVVDWSLSIFQCYCQYHGLIFILFVSLRIIS